MGFYFGGSSHRKGYPSPVWHWNRDSTEPSRATLAVLHPFHPSWGKSSTALGDRGRFVDAAATITGLDRAVISPGKGVKSALCLNEKGRLHMCGVNQNEIWIFVSRETIWFYSQMSLSCACSMLPRKTQSVETMDYRVGNSWFKLWALENFNSFVQNELIFFGKGCRPHWRLQSCGFHM